MMHMVANHLARRLMRVMTRFFAGHCMTSEVICQGPEKCMGIDRKIGNDVTAHESSGSDFTGYDERTVLTHLQLRRSCQQLRKIFVGGQRQDRGVAEGFTSALAQYNGGNKGRRTDSLLLAENMLPGSVMHRFFPAFKKKLLSRKGADGQPMFQEGKHFVEMEDVGWAAHTRYAHLPKPRAV